MGKKRADGLLKIGELARAANTSISTVKHYVNQGLVEIATKTSANMAYYHPSNVQRILLIKQLQKEKFYPLTVIKGLLSGKENDVEIELLDAIHKVSPADNASAAPHGATSIPLRAAAKETGLSRKQIDALLDAGLIAPETVEGKKVFTAHAAKIMRLIKRRTDAGMPFPLTLASFSIYTDALMQAAHADVNAMIRYVLLPGNYGAKEIARLIRLSDSTLDEFIQCKRDQLNRRYGSARVEDLERFLADLASFQQSLPPHAPSNSAAYTGTLAALDALFQAREGAGLAVGASAGQRAKAFFLSLDPAQELDASCRLFLYAMRHAFFSLAPDVLDCAQAAENTRRTFLQDIAGCLPQDAAETLVQDIFQRLNKNGGEET